MSLIIDIESAWLEKVWKHKDMIDSYLFNVFNFEITEDSESEISVLLDTQGFLNYVEAVTILSYGERLIGGGSKAQHGVSVEIRYTKEKDVIGNTYRNIITFFEELNKLVESELGQDWSGLVDYFERQAEAPSITEATIAGRKCFRGIFRFTAKKLKTI